MNFIASETPQKLRGGYYTDPDIAAFLVHWVREIEPRRLLEPACGDGAFLEAFIKLGARPEAVTACELNPEEAAKAKRKGRALGGMLDLVEGDFLEWALSRGDFEPAFDAVVGNPPFIRYQYLDPVMQERAERVFQRFGLAFTKHANAWVPFVIASLAMLRPHGRLAMVIPSELLHVLHARSLRDFLVQQCSRVLVIDPEEIWFHDTLQGVVLLLAEKRAPCDTGRARVAITPVRGQNALRKPAREYVGQADFISSSVLNDKWMVGLLSKSERSLWESLRCRDGISALGDVASVDVGIVTGANKFFLVSDDTVHTFELEQWAHPMFGRSEHVRGVIYSRSDHAENRRQGLPANFLWFPADATDKWSARALRDIVAGEAQMLHRRFKCRIRSPWYRVPSVFAAPVGMLKRCHHFPRMILNTAKAFTTDTAYRIVPKGLCAADLVWSFVNSMTALSAELEGRHYGGGVLELVPSEVEKMLVPLGGARPGALAELDRAVRDGTAPEHLLTAQDELLLRPLGIGKQDSQMLLNAWMRLRGRRHRVSPG